MTYKLDIFDTLAAIDGHDLDFYSRLDDAQRKGFAPPVVLRWASAVQSSMADWYLLITNENANIHFDAIWEHPELQFKLLAAGGDGRRQRHQWIGKAKSKGKGDKLSAFLSRFYPDANRDELNLLLAKFTPKTFAEFLEDSGCSPEEAKEVMDVYGEITGTKVAKSKARSRRKS